ncbi:hypothetical protein GTY92_28600 [Streptomyces sp. SID4950]|nr:hypothetical protein [Streptomyces sp. SID4950]
MNEQLGAIALARPADVSRTAFRLLVAVREIGGGRRRARDVRDGRDHRRHPGVGSVRSLSPDRAGVSVRLCSRGIGEFWCCPKTLLFSLPGIRKLTLFVKTAHRGRGGAGEKGLC